MATEQEIQSMLLRLSVLLATSLATLSEPTPPTIISDPSSSSSSAYDGLRSQIVNDVNVLLSSIQKACTNLTLALRPDSKHGKEVREDFSPTSGLDPASLEAASAQLADLTNDFIPKLTWLARKSASEATVYKYVSKSDAEMKKEKEELELVRSRGGHIVRQPHFREEEKMQKVKGRGVGAVWSRAVVAVMTEVLEALGGLSEAFMSSKTLAVLSKASIARMERAGQGRIEPHLEVKTSLTMEAARQHALKATAIVWEVCDSAKKAKLPKDNRTAVLASWKGRTEVLHDALREFKEALQEEGIENGQPEESDEEDDFFDMQGESLSGEERERAAQWEPLLKAGCQLHGRIGEATLKTEQDVDYDELDTASESFAAAVDALVSNLLYGIGVDVDDDDEQSGDDDDDDASSHEDSTGAAKAVNDASLRSALAAFQSSTLHLKRAGELASPHGNEELDKLSAKFDDLCKGKGMV